MYLSSVPICTYSAKTHSLWTKRLALSPVAEAPENCNDDAAASPLTCHTQGSVVNDNSFERAAMVASTASPSPQSLQAMSETRPPLWRVPQTLADRWVLTKPIVMKIQVRPRAKLKGFPRSKSRRALKELSRRLAKAAHNPVEPSSRLHQCCQPIQIRSRKV